MRARKHGDNVLGGPANFLKRHFQRRGRAERHRSRLAAPVDFFFQAEKGDASIGQRLFDHRALYLGRRQTSPAAPKARACREQLLLFLRAMQVDENHACGERTARALRRRLVAQNERHLALHVHARVIIIAVFFGGDAVADENQLAFDFA
jgi:hypothetical protein